MPHRKSRLLAALVVAILVLVTAFLLIQLFRPAGLNRPESIAYDATAKRFLVSNTGNGSILSLNDAGKRKPFLKGLNNPRGLKIFERRLYVADNDQIRVVDLDSGKLTGSIAVPGAVMLNDIECDREGLLYITDTRANRLFILDPATKKTRELKSGLLNAPNGIVYDYPRRQMLIVCLAKSSPVLSFDLVSQTFSVFKTTLYDDLDGIAIDDLGRIYFSSWGERAIFRIPQEQNRTLIWQSEIASPADIYYHQLTNEIIVPVMNRNEIRRFPAD